MNTIIEKKAKEMAERALVREKHIREAIKENIEKPDETVLTTEKMK